MVEISSEEEVLLTIREVYYDEEGKPFAHGEPFVCGENLEELRAVVDRITQAINTPVLKSSDFPNQDDLEQETQAEAPSGRPISPKNPLEP